MQKSKTATEEIGLLSRPKEILLNLFDRVAQNQLHYCCQVELSVEPEQINYAAIYSVEF